MKVVFLNGDVPNLYDGYHKLTKEIIKAISEQFSLHVIAYKGGEIKSNELPMKIESYQTLVHEKGAIYKKRFNQVLSLFSNESMIPLQFKAVNITQLNDRLQEIDPDVIVVNHLRAAWAVPYLCSKLRATLIYIAHNCESLAYASIADLQTNQVLKSYTKAEAKKILRLEKRVLDRVDYCVSLTPEDAERMEKIHSGPKHLVIPPGTNIPIFKKDETKEIGLLLIGSYKWNPKKKNALWLANEVLPLLNHGKQKVRLKLVGQAANELEGAIKDKTYVEVHSDVPDITTFLKDNHIFIIPERQESGFKIKTLEAASYGLPIVSTSAGIEGTQLRDESSCLVANTKEEFVVQIQRLLKDPKLRIQIGAKAKDEATKHFQWRSIKNQYIHLINEAANMTPLIGNHPKEDEKNVSNR